MRIRSTDSPIIGQRDQNFRPTQWNQIVSTASASLMVRQQKFEKCCLVSILLWLRTKETATTTEKQISFFFKIALERILYFTMLPWLRICSYLQTPTFEFLFTASVC